LTSQESQDKSWPVIVRRTRALNQSSNMGKLSDEGKIAVKAGMVVAGIISTFALRYVEPTRGVGKVAMASHALFAVFVTRTVNGTGHTGPSRFCATSP